MEVLGKLEIVVDLMLAKVSSNIKCLETWNIGNKNVTRHISARNTFEL